MREIYPDDTDHKKLRLESEYRRDAYYEKLALVSGGTIGLSVSAVLSAGNHLKHHYTLAFGLTCLTISMVSLMLRNLSVINNSSHLVDLMFGAKSRASEVKSKYVEGLKPFTQASELVGILAMIIGIGSLALVLVLSII